MLKIIGLFCKRALQKRPVFCKETCIFKHPTNRSHPISLETYLLFLPGSLPLPPPLSHSLCVWGGGGGGSTFIQKIDSFNAYLVHIFCVFHDRVRDTHENDRVRDTHENEYAYASCAHLLCVFLSLLVFARMCLCSLSHRESELQRTTASEKEQAKTDMSSDSTDMSSDSTDMSMFALARRWLLNFCLCSFSAR